MWTGAHGGRLTKSMMLMWPRPFKKWSAGNLPNSTNEKRDFVLYCRDCRSPCSRWNRLPLIADTARSRPSKQAHSAPESLITFWGFFFFFFCLVSCGLVHSSRQQSPDFSFSFLTEVWDHRILLLNLLCFIMLCVNVCVLRLWLRSHSSLF